ncbi:MAG TPA: carbon-nitrogen hydrolase family protein [Actinoplanes sp.]|jgi:predicted amidohydrolase
MREPLTVAVAQPLTVPYDIGVNAVAHAAVIRSANAQVVVFPEFSLTGYELDAAPITADDPRLDPVVQACADSGSTALVGAPLAGSGGRAYVAVLAVDRGGVRVAYRKMCLGGDEPHHFTPGDAPAVLEVGGWRLGLAVCKDTGQAGHTRATVALGIDAYVAGLVDTADWVTVQEERARRIVTEHRVWVAFASFAGPTGGPFSKTAARSRIWDPDGRVVADAGTEIGAVARATLR